MPMILSNYQMQQLRDDMAELEAYRELGTLEEVRAWKPDPAPLPLDLCGEELHLGAGLLDDDGYDPALEAAGRRETEQWHK